MTKNPSARAQRRLPRWALVLLIVLAVVVVAGLVLPHFLDVDRYRPTIAATVEQQTGRKLTLGAIHARFLPTVGFTVDGVGLGNPPGFPDGELIHVDSMSGGLAVGPLLHRQIEITSLEFVKPKLTLLSAPGGRTNYDFSTSATSSGGHAKLRQPAKPSGGGSSFSLQEIGKISLTDAEVALADVVHGRIQPGASVRGLNVAASHVMFDESMMKQLEADADFKGVRIESASLAEPIDVQSGKLKVSQGQAQADVRMMVGKELDVKAAVKVADLSKPVAEFDVSTPQLDLDALSKLFSGKGTGGESSAASAAAAPIGESELLARGKITVERIKFESYTANNAVVEVRLYTDRMEAFPAHMDLYGGTVQVSARADRRQTPLRFSANVELNNIDVGKLVSTDPSLKGKITGTGDLKLENVYGSAGSRLLDTLTGKGDFVVRDGQLPGFNLPGALAFVGKLTGGAGSTSTPFKIIQGDLTIGGGRVASKQIHMDSPVGTMDLNGSFGFDGSVSYQGQATLVPSAGGGGAEQMAVGALTGLLGNATGRKITKATVPFSVGGTFSDIKIRPGKAIPKFESSAASQTTTPGQQKPSLADTLKGLFKKP